MCRSAPKVKTVSPMMCASISPSPLKSSANCTTSRFSPTQRGRQEASGALAANQALFDGTRVAADKNVAERLAALTDSDFVRQPARAERQKAQREALNLPLLPTTTIGSFPQTKEIRAERAKLRKGEVTKKPTTSSSSPDRRRHQEAGGDRPRRAGPRRVRA